MYKPYLSVIPLLKLYNAFNASFIFMESFESQCKYFYLFLVDKFNQGAVNKSIIATYTSNCCHPGVLFVGLDLVGNMGTCSINLVPEIVSMRAKPSTTSLSLFPGDTTKVPFKLVNLGSKGSFSFEVTKVPALISYVMPFSLVLKANTSTAGQVVIKSRGEVRKPQNLTVKAVIQPGTVHERKIALFSIRVALSRYKVKFLWYVCFIPKWRQYCFYYFRLYLNFLFSALCLN